MLLLENTNLKTDHYRENFVDKNTLATSWFASYQCDKTLKRSNLVRKAFISL